MSKPHRNKYDRRGYWQKCREDCEWARQRSVNYYHNKLKKLKTSRVITPAHHRWDDRWRTRTTT